MTRTTEFRKTPIVTIEGGYLSARSRLDDFVQREYLLPKGSRIFKQYHRHSREIEDEVSANAFNLVALALSRIESEDQIDFLAERISSSIVGHWSEILVLQTLRKSPQFETCTCSYTQMNLDIQKPGVDIRIRTKKQYIYFDLFTGIWQEVLMEKLNDLIKFRAKYWFLVPLCLDPKELPENLRNFLKNFPCLDPKELRVILAKVLLNVATKGEFPEEVITPELEQIVESRVLAGYLITKSLRGSNLKKIDLLEQMLRKRGV